MTLTFENFQGCMKSWETHWDHYIYAQGDYFEGHRGKLGVTVRKFFMVKFPEFLGSPMHKHSSLVDVSQQTTAVHDFSACFQGVPYKNVNEAGVTEFFTATNNIKLFYRNEETPTHLNYQMIHHKTRL